MTEIIHWTARHPIQNSLIFIHDDEDYDLPEIDGIGRHWATPTCVAVSCSPGCDADTIIDVGDPSDVRQSDHQIFDGWLNTPSRRIKLDAVHIERIGELAVPCTMTRLRIWTDGHQDSEFVSIGVSQ
ncbi:hypothetical protein [Aurantimonas marina]|uniref:hypothetical protein n=1 Tax=Aurantimonas marina TaxID=2780508 RepID=UPI0019D01773|nr:hypothetical protein [Aurantimonas marina]